MFIAISQNVLKALVVTLIVALLGAILSPQIALSTPARRPIRPGYFFLPEFLAGLAGAYAGGLAASTRIKRLSTEGGGAIVIVGLGTGIVAGAATGVAIAGSLLGVNGNLLFAPLGAGFGMINAFALIYLLEIQQEQELHPWVRTAIALGLPAYGAAVGYNIGAKVRTKSGKAGGEESGGTKLGITKQPQSELSIPLLVFKVEF